MDIMFTPEGEPQDVKYTSEVYVIRNSGEKNGYEYSHVVVYKYNAGNEICKYFNQLTQKSGIIFSEEILNKYITKVEFTGIAYCSVNDEFNETIGIRIAKRRAKQKFHQSFSKALEKILMEMIGASVDIQKKSVQYAKWSKQPIIAE